VAVLSDDVMKGSLLLLLLVAVRAVIGGTNRSLLPDDTCVPTVLEGVLLSAGNLPDRLLNLKPVAMQAAQDVTGGVRDLEQLLKLKLRDHHVLMAIAVSLSRPPENATVVYRSADERIQVHRLNNLSSLVDKTWRNVLDADWNQSSKASDTSELWTPPFLDCLTRKWLFGYSVSLHRYSLIWARSSPCFVPG
jgi:hypothetical protein